MENSKVPNNTNDRPYPLEHESVHIDDPVIEQTNNIRYADKCAEGYKADEDKLRHDLISPYAVEGLAQVLTYGSVKYDDRNWQKGMKWHRAFAACQRHLNAFWKGEDIDPESRMLHIDHAQACLHFLSHYQRTREFKEFDDRAPARNND